MPFKGLILLAILTIAATAAPVRSAPALTLSSESPTVIAGDDIVVSVILGEAYDMAGYYLELQCDFTLLTEAPYPLLATPLAPASDYVFGDNKANFMAWSQVLPDGGRSGYSDFLEDSINGGLLGRNQAVNGGDSLAVLTIPTDSEHRGVVNFRINTDTLELFDASTADIAGFAQLLSDLENAAPLTVSVVPEPASLALLAAGAMTMVRRRR